MFYTFVETFLYLCRNMFYNYVETYFIPMSKHVL